MPPVLGVLETVLYAPDLDAAMAFYRDVLGFAASKPIGDVGVALRISERQMLLIFHPERASLPGRMVPSHGTLGEGHVGLRIEAADYDAWIERLRSHAVPIELEMQWTEANGWRVGRSIYFRDPAGNSVELMTADIWPEQV